jgi:hypothetical protein
MSWWITVEAMRLVPGLRRNLELLSAMPPAGVADESVKTASAKADGISTYGTDDWSQS